jgi:hypothetical protein
VHRGYHHAALVRQVLHRREDALRHDRVQACQASTEPQAHKGQGGLL